jgi:hypothetical protein
MEPYVEFDYPDDEPEETATIVAAANTVTPNSGSPSFDSDQARFWRRYGAIKALTLLTGDGHGAKIAYRAEILSYLLKASTCKNQRELAGRLGVTPGRVSQIIKRVKRGIDQLSQGIDSPV